MNNYQLRFRRIVQLVAAMTAVTVAFALIPSVQVHDDYTNRLIETRSAFGWRDLCLFVLVPLPAYLSYRAPRKAHLWWWLPWMMVIGVVSKYTPRSWPALSYTEITWPAHAALWARRVTCVLLLGTLLAAIVSRSKPADQVAPAKVV